MKTLKVALPAGILMAGFMLFTSISYGTTAMAKKEGKACVVCHTAMGKKDLNETGKCYKENNSLDKCAVPAPKK